TSGSAHIPSLSLCLCRRPESTACHVVGAPVPARFRGRTAAPTMPGRRLLKIPHCAMNIAVRVKPLLDLKQKKAPGTHEPEFVIPSAIARINQVVAAIIGLPMSGCTEGGCGETPSCHDSKQGLCQKQKQGFSRFFRGRDIF